MRLVVDAVTGTVAQRLDYDEFGRVLTDTNPGFQPFGFAGGLYEPETGLVRFGARDYDANFGRWTARDPILFHGGSQNLYTYTGSDPINATDPQGRIISAIIICLIIPELCGLEPGGSGIPGSGPGASGAEGAGPAPGGGAGGASEGPAPGPSGDPCDDDEPEPDDIITLCFFQYVGRTQSGTTVCVYRCNEKTAGFSYGTVDKTPLLPCDKALTADKLTPI